MPAFPRTASDVVTNRPPRSRPWSRIGAVSIVLSLLLGLTACTDEAAQEDAPRSGSVRADVSLGTVTGSLPRARRTAIKRVVGTTVNRWIEAAYVPGGYPRARFTEAFRTFTRDATTQARRDRTLTSNRAISQRLSSVRLRQRKIRVDVLARGGRPVGATARVVVAQRLQGPRIDRVERITGRLHLTPTARGWQIFAYDLQRGRLR